MWADDYQKGAMRTIGEFPVVMTPAQQRMLFAAIEMCSEAGEAANVVYKHVFQGHPLNTYKLMEELGDVLWGIAAQCDTLGVTMSEVMEFNQDKLKRRYPDRFSPEASMARVDVPKKEGAMAEHGYNAYELERGHPHHD